MESARFDGLTRSVSILLSRRGLLGGLAALLLRGSIPDDVVAKKHKRKRRRKPRPCPECPPPELCDSARRCCLESQLCPAPFANGLMCCLASNYMQCIDTNEGKICCDVDRICHTDNGTVCCGVENGCACTGDKCIDNKCCPGDRLCQNFKACCQPHEICAQQPTEQCCPEQRYRADTQECCPEGTVATEGACCPAAQTCGQWPTAHCCPDGCCDSNGNCQPGTANTACGKGGFTCADCSTSGDRCGSNRTCESTCVPVLNSGCDAAHPCCHDAHFGQGVCCKGFCCSQGSICCPDGNYDACCSTGWTCREGGGCVFVPS